MNECGFGESVLIPAATANNGHMSVLGAITWHILSFVYLARAKYVLYVNLFVGIMR